MIMPTSLRALWCAAFSVLLVLASATSPLAAGDAIDDRVDQFLRDNQVPGLSLGIVREGSVVKARGYGKASLEWDTPVTERTVYQIGSISKTFTAAAVMLLVEEEKLRLDDRVGQFATGDELPEAIKALTLKQLISHTSGVRSFSEIDAFSYRRDYSWPEFLKLIGKQPLDFEPGSKFHYSNSGPPLASLAVAQVAGTSFERFVAERVFERLDMTATRYEDDQAIVRERSAGHVLREGSLLKGVPVRPKVIAASGGILSNVLDLMKYDAALDGERLLPRATLQKMWTPVTLGDGEKSPYGLGWFLTPYQGHPRVFHGGSTAGGFEAAFVRFTDPRLTVIVLSNRQSAPVAKLATDLVEIVEPDLAQPAR
jgi:CubicO group peptidase (beta-lactamase class C family)